MYVAPEHDEDAFSCPHCGAYTTQTWSNLYSQRKYAKDPPYNSTPFSQSNCFHCNKSSYWYEEKLIIPASATVPMPSQDLPEHLKPLYLEARSIANASPRGAAALLRLLIQILMKDLQQSGKNIDQDIATLAKEGKLRPTTIKMFHTVRIAGNEAVHPGEIDFEDDAEIANALFYLINMIMFDAVTYDNYAEAMWQKMPESKRKAAEARDLLGSDL